MPPRKPVVRRAPAPSVPPGTPVAQIRLRLLGEAALLVVDEAKPDEAKPIRIDNRECAALLARLSLDGAQSQKLLCTWLWPAARTEKLAANSIRTLCTRLKKRAGGTALIELGSSLRLVPALQPSDASNPARLSHDELLRADELLAGFDFGDNSEVDRWLSQARLRIAERCAEALAAQAERLTAERRLHEAIPFARRVVELVPRGEHGVRRLMRLHYLRHDGAAAMAVYRQFETLLRDGGETPADETRRSMQTLLQAEAAEAARRQPQPVPPSLLHTPLLVGRDACLGAMRAAWSRRMPFLLVGEAGAGKSRLLDALQDELQHCIRERARSGDELAPLGLMGRLLDAVEREHAPAVAAAVRAELGRIRPGFGLAPTLPADTLQVRNAVARYLRAAVDKGLRALLLDDLQHADADSIALLRWLCDSDLLQDLRWGLASRPPADAPGAAQLLRWLGESQRPLHIAVPPLAQHDIARLLQSLELPGWQGHTAAAAPGRTQVDASLDPETKALAARLHKHTGGNAFLILATLEYALARGIDPRCQPLPHPESVHSLLQAGMRALPAPAQRLLQVAAVAGAELRADRLARLLGRRVIDLAEAWSQLEAARILSGERLSHDLMHESALRTVPQGVRQALHRDLAQLLVAERDVPAATIAHHWEAGEAWLQAAPHWRTAADSAWRAGCLPSQIALLERAADCAQRGNDGEGRFDALQGRLEALRQCHGADRVLEALAELEPLADSGLRRLRCQLAQMAALVDLERGAEAGALAAQAVRAAAQHPQLLGDACALQAQALAQVGSFDGGRAAAVRAVELSSTTADPLQALRALQARMYVSYAEGRLAEAVSWQQQALARAEQLGQPSAVARGTAQLAALLAAIGDVPASAVQARLAERLQRNLGMAANSSLRIANCIVRGNAATALGQYSEALDALQLAVALAGDEAAQAARAKSRQSLAALWLTLGCPQAAGELLDQVPDRLPAGPAMQQLLLRHRVAVQMGQTTPHYLQALAKLDREHPDLPLVLSAHFEASFTGDAATMVARLVKVRADCVGKGLHGTANSMGWRELVRRLDTCGATPSAEMLALTLQLQPQVAGGLSAKCRPPQVWQTLATVFARAGDTTRAQDCTDQARHWIDRALTTVPPQWRAGAARAHRIDSEGTP